MHEESTCACSLYFAPVHFKWNNQHTAKLFLKVNSVILWRKFQVNVYPLRGYAHNYQDTWPETRHPGQHDLKREFILTHKIYEIRFLKPTVITLILCQTTYQLKITFYNAYRNCIVQFCVKINPSTLGVYRQKYCCCCYYYCCSCCLVSNKAGRWVCNSRCAWWTVYASAHCCKVLSFYERNLSIFSDT